jgi:hypothetical protein
VEEKLQQAVDAWADEQNEAVNSASKAAEIVLVNIQIYIGCTFI